MSELGPEDEALLRGARAGLEATPDDQARVKRRLFAQLGIGLATGGSAISTSAGASASAGVATTVATGTTLVTKLLITVAVVGLVSGGVLVVKSSRTHSNVVSPSASANAVTSPLPQQPTELSALATASAAPIAPLDTSQSSLPATPPIANAPAHRSSLQPSDPVAASDRATGADHASSIDTTNLAPQTAGVTPSNVGQAAVLPTPVAAGPATVDAEAALLRNADAELKADRADHALALLDQHATQFPNGVLTEEREAERVIVLCALGRKQEAQDAAQSFLSAHPHSPEAARIRSSCGGN
jgi:hypothetical protein